MKYELISWKHNVATVKFLPNKVEKFFGCKEATKTFFYTGNVYVLDDKMMWFCGKTGKRIGRFGKLDNLVRLHNIQK